MKNKQILLMLMLTVAGLCTFGLNKSYARGMVIWGEAEKIRKIAEIPDNAYYITEEGDTGYYVSEDGTNFDFGVIYNTIHVFWIPMWVKTEPKVCGYIDGDNYVELTDEDVKLISSELKIDLTGKVKASLWDRFGGKAIVIVLVVFGVYFYFKEKKEGTDEEKSEESGS